MQKLVWLLITISLLSGCATTSIGRTANALSKAGGSLYSPPYYMTEEVRDKLYSKKLGDPLDSDGRTLIYRCLVDINKNYGNYIDILTMGRAGVNILYDSLTLGLSGASTAFTPNSTKTVLSGLSTFFQGQKVSFDKNLFDDKVIFALTSIMEVRRADALITITRKLASADYLLGEALVDLESLYRAGCLQTALQAAYLNQPQPSVLKKDEKKEKKGVQSESEQTKAEQEDEEARITKLPLPTLVTPER